MGRSDVELAGIFWPNDPAPQPLRIQSSTIILLAVSHVFETWKLKIDESLTNWDLC
jgi:hypothetical protein